MKIHDLKCREPFFAAIVCGDKRCEVRLFDREYEVGDLLVLRQAVEILQPVGPSTWEPTSNYHTVRVSHLLLAVGEVPGLIHAGNLAIMSIEPLNATELAIQQIADVALARLTNIVEECL